ncbi:hypothetical protein A3860_04965 [Niastella vici]|uniref:6-bladed beta-propeller n=1 Tax=Niastella vici TaxID=1703345 RepID=A0A1V9FS07_9BACT|nr:6-bladed beta-propeller [Niastella vici]OQP61071.1 hypothetical protein A3860_04965 [Niastella vici]
MQLKVFRESCKAILLGVSLLSVACGNKEQGEARAKRFFKGYEDVAGRSTNVPSVLIENNGAPTIKIDKKSIAELFLMQDIVDSIRYVKLETNNYNLIGRIDELYFDDGLIFVVDKEIASSVFIFDKEGKIISKIHNVGKGPGEYLGVNNVAIDRRHKRILLYDMYSRKINYYDYKGRFLKEERTMIYFSDIKIHPKTGEYVFATYGIPNLHIPSLAYNYLIVGDSTKKFNHKGIPFTPELSVLSLWGNFGLNDNNNLIGYTPRFSDSILAFNVAADKLLVKYIFDCGANGLKYENKYTMDTKELYTYLNKKELLYFNGKYIETNKYLYFTLVTENKIVHGLYEKGTQQLVVTSGVGNDNYTVPVFAMPVTNFDDWFVGVVPVSRFIWNKNNFNARMKDDPGFAKLINTTQENDNPVLAFYKFKSLKDLGK